MFNLKSVKRNYKLLKIYTVNIKSDSIGVCGVKTKTAASTNGDLYYHTLPFTALLFQKYVNENVSLFNFNIFLERNFNENTIKRFDCRPKG